MNISSPIKRLTSKGQLTLPVAVRKAWGIKPGDKLELTIGKGNVLLIRPQPMRKKKEATNL